MLLGKATEGYGFAGSWSPDRSLSLALEGWRAENIGAEGRSRTADTTIFSRVLYQLSYLGRWRG